MVVVWAEDEEADRQLIRAALGDDIGQVHFVDNGEHALAELARSAPKLLVLDVNMPRLGGVETLRRVRQDPAHTALPVVMFSTAKSEEPECRRLGIVDFVEKPLRFAQFSNAVQRITAMVPMST